MRVIARGGAVMAPGMSKAVRPEVNFAAHHYLMRILSSPNVSPHNLDFMAPGSSSKDSYI
jgi:hypothetical protein